jgi:hypothetical protein
MRIAYVSFVALLLMTACEVPRVNTSCANVDQKVAMLKKEKGYNTMREKDKVYTVTPPAMTYRVVAGDDAVPVKMTTEEWDTHLDRAIEELQDCGLMDRRNTSRQGHRTVIKTRSGSLY